MVLIDLRSDTVTVPGEGMREAIAHAAVGDDQFGEDPSVNRLQDRIAWMLGKEAALWLPTGTMANQVALRTLTRPGDDVIAAAGAHLVWNEAGAGAANSGVQFTELGGDRGWFTVDEFEAAVKPRGHIVMPPSTLVALENTHNRAGGRVVPEEVAVAVGEAAREMGLASLLDGARLWNAATATGLDLVTMAAPFDLVWVAFSKGLGAPGGSMLAGPSDLIARAHRHRRMLGGAMRQVGIFAAAAEYALDHHLSDLASDHAKARSLAEELAGSDAIDIDPAVVDTNIIMFRPNRVAPEVVCQRAADEGLGVFPFGSRVRAVTHRDVTMDDCLTAAGILIAAAEG